ncbi:MAG: PEP-CTERM sorting domain-containing protein [Pirellulales bacterium]|nr:PEP-CTERM sorting domain-containing protein [Pirellulales bacterium]
MITRRNLMLACLGLSLAVVVSPASAASYNVDWMQMTPTAFGSPPPFSGTYNLPGIGTVLMTYSPIVNFTEARFQNVNIATGSLPYGGDTYSWTNNEMLARTNFNTPPNPINTAWQVTYTFSGTVPAGKLILGVSGLGRRNPTPGSNETVADCTSTASVSQNGTYFGDWTNGQNWGATSFSGGAGNFSMQNSQIGNGGNDPWWNTGLALVRIDDPVSSLTVNFTHTSGDGLGVNIGTIVPEPGTLALLGAGLLGLLFWVWRKSKS